VKQKDTKLLWGRAANRCAICRRELSQDAAGALSAYPIGEQAHIIAAETDGPRGQSPLTREQRDSYHNIILLCPNHHTEVDNNFCDWPPEKLHLTKSQHELWVREKLSESDDQVRLSTQVAVTYIIDSAVDLLWLETWKDWTQGALLVAPSWPGEMPNQTFEFRQRVGTAIWPNEFNELHRATTTLAIYINAAAKNFVEHARFNGRRYDDVRFYSENGWNTNYDRDLDIYTKWIRKGYDLLYKSTAAANWFADVVRRDVNPMFFAKTGKFVVVKTDGLLGQDAQLYEFTEEQRSNLPGSLTEDSA
jgi:hypothetical protein